MRKTLIFSLGLLLLIGSLSLNGICQTMDEVRAKMIDALGGRKVLEAIKDTTFIATMEIPKMGINGTMTMYQKEPDKMRMDQEFMGQRVTQGFDGKTAWFTNPMTGKAEEMPEKSAAEMKRQAFGNDSLLNPEKYGITYTLKGKAKEDDKDCFVIEQTFSDSRKATIFIDANTYLNYKVRATTVNEAGVETEIETIFSVYKKVGDTLVAHSMAIKQGGEAFAKMNVSEVSFNTGLEDSLFKIPE
jgi:outer membrane lipoprotein-sorting protein